MGVHVHTAEILWVDRWSLAQTIHYNIDTTYTNSCQLKGGTTDSAFSLADYPQIGIDIDNRFSEHMTVYTVHSVSQ